MRATDWIIVIRQSLGTRLPWFPDRWPEKDSGYRYVALFITVPIAIAVISAIVWLYQVLPWWLAVFPDGVLIGVGVWIVCVLVDRTLPKKIDPHDGPR